MAITNKVLVGSIDLTTSIAAYYNVPVNTTTQIRKCTITNHGAVAAKFTIYLVPSAGTPTIPISYNVPVASGKSVEVFELEGQIIETGSSIQAVSDTGGALAIRVSGVEII